MYAGFAFHFIMSCLKVVETFIFFVLPVSCGKIPTIVNVL